VSEHRYESYVRLRVEIEELESAGR
jgi:hypothetical protein